MTGLRLKKIADKTPVKITLSLPPEVHADLLIYAEIYRKEHGSQETQQVLAAQMIATFMQGDTQFRKDKRSLLENLNYDRSMAN